MPVPAYGERPDQARSSARRQTAISSCRSSDREIAEVHPSSVTISVSVLPRHLPPALPVSRMRWSSTSSEGEQILRHDVVAAVNDSCPRCRHECTPARGWPQVDVFVLAGLANQLDAVLAKTAT
jgi:hypothetical protein